MGRCGSARLTPFELVVLRQGAAVIGHGLVREDMHSGSISHLGIVVLPTLLSLAQ